MAETKAPWWWPGFRPITWSRSRPIAAALVLPEQLGEVGVIRSRVAAGGEAHHGRGDVGRDGVVRTAPAVAVLQRRGSARTVGGEEPPRVSRADAQDLGGLRGLQISGHHPVEYVASCCFGLLHCHPPARWLGTDRFAAPLTTDRIAAQRHADASHSLPRQRGPLSGEPSPTSGSRWAQTLRPHAPKGFPPRAQPCPEQRPLPTSVNTRRCARRAEERDEPTTATSRTCRAHRGR